MSSSQASSEGDKWGALWDLQKRWINNTGIWLVDRNGWFCPQNIGFLYRFLATNSCLFNTGWCPKNTSQHDRFVKGGAFLVTPWWTSDRWYHLSPIPKTTQKWLGFSFQIGCLLTNTCFWQVYILFMLVVIYIPCSTHKYSLTKCGSI